MNRGSHGIRSEANRPVVMGRRGMVCSGHPLASQAGAGILQQGGNAVDAAIAVASALNLVEPDMSGIGGDGFVMIYDAESGEINVANGTGAAPRRATREEYRNGGIPTKGARSVSVPGTGERMACCPQALWEPEAGGGIPAGDRSGERWLADQSPASREHIRPTRL